MQPIEKKILKFNEKILALTEQRRLVSEELSYHRHIDDDAQRDATVGDSDDRSFARASARDVTQFEQAERDLGAKLKKLTKARDQLLEQLE